MEEPSKEELRQAEIIGKYFDIRHENRIEAAEQYLDTLSDKDKKLAVYGIEQLLITKWIKENN